jgi:hypothetical protein
MSVDWCRRRVLDEVRLQKDALAADRRLYQSKAIFDRARGLIVTFAADYRDA